MTELRPQGWLPPIPSKGRNLASTPLRAPGVVDLTLATSPPPPDFTELGLRPHPSGNLPPWSSWHKKATSGGGSRAQQDAAVTQAWAVLTCSAEEQVARGADAASAPAYRAAHGALSLAGAAKKSARRKARNAGRKPLIDQAAATAAQHLAADAATAAAPMPADLPAENEQLRAQLADRSPGLSSPLSAFGDTLGSTLAAAMSSPRPTPRRAGGRGLAAGTTSAATLREPFGISKFVKGVELGLFGGSPRPDSQLETALETLDKDARSQVMARVVRRNKRLRDLADLTSVLERMFPCKGELGRAIEGLLSLLLRRPGSRQELERWPAKLIAATGAVQDGGTTTPPLLTMTMLLLGLATAPGSTAAPGLHTRLRADMGGATACGMSSPAALPEYITQLWLSQPAPAAPAAALGRRPAQQPPRGQPT